jgi:hypothetical protein
MTCAEAIRICSFGKKVSKGVGRGSKLRILSPSHKKKTMTEKNICIFSFCNVFTESQGADAEGEYNNSKWQINKTGAAY